MCMGLDYPHLFLPFFAGMQPFFVATEQFSVQNGRMQEQKAGKILTFLRKIRWVNLIFLMAGVGVLLMGAGAVLYGYRDLPTSSWRESHTDFPIPAVALHISQIDAEWKNAKGNVRMELRTAYYPEATINLSGGRGTGRLFVRFLNAKGTHEGDIISIPYREGRFVTYKDVTFEADGATATVRLEKGYAEKSEYLLHRLNEEEPLWRVQIWQQPADSSTTYYLGYTTITPNAE